VKFEQQLEEETFKSTEESTAHFSEIKSYLRRKNKQRKAKRAAPFKCGVQKHLRNTKFSYNKTKKQSKKLNFHKVEVDRTNFTNSKPSSVTSLFTASSTGNNILQNKLGSTTKGLNPLNSESDCDKEMLEREIIQCIEEKVTINGLSQPPSGQISKEKTSKLKMFRNMYLISEIEGETESRNKISKDKSMLGVSYHSTTTKSGEEIDSTEKVSFKTNETTLKSQGKKRVTIREFNCFEESSVIKFKGIHDMKLPYNLTKGDDDEDSEDEDVKNGKGYLQLHLEKAVIDQNKAFRKSHY